MDDPTAGVTEDVRHPPVDQVLQAPPLFLILFQLLPPRLPFLGGHSLQEPPLSHGFGLRREQSHSQVLEHGVGA